MFSGRELKWFGPKLINVCLTYSLLAFGFIKLFFIRYLLRYGSIYTSEIWFWTQIDMQLVKLLRFRIKEKTILFDSVLNYRAAFICKLVVLSAILKHIISRFDSFKLLLLNSFLDPKTKLIDSSKKSKCSYSWQHHIQLMILLMIYLW